jgi:hypothetical protein
MAYLAPGAFRTDSLDEACKGLALDEPGDAALTAAIARLSQRIDDWTYDHFETETAATVNLSGGGGSRLYLPKRCRAVTTVKLRDVSGTLGAAVTSTAYRLRSSLTSTGDARVDGSNLDWIEIVPYGVGIGMSSWGSSPWGWPRDANAIEVVGDFGWLVTPGDIQRALAMLVWDHFKGQRPSLYATESVQTDTFVERFPRPDSSTGVFSGMALVDGIIANYRRGMQDVMIG